MIAMAIFGIMSVSVMSVYFHITATTHRMNAQRQVAETAREILERIGSDIEEYGVHGSAPDFDVNYELWR